jgi:hypothetical protein
MRISKLVLAFILLALSVGAVSAGTITVFPDTPDLSDTAGTVVGNAAAAPGFGSGSWQATQHNPYKVAPEEQKSNYYVTPQELFGAGAVVTVGQVLSMSYWTDQLNSPGNSNWNLYIYTVPTGTDDSAGWYKSRLVAIAPKGDADGWDQWSTGSLDFSDPSRNNSNYTTSITWANITSGPVTWANGVPGNSRNYSTEIVEYFSLQTDSGATTFRGLVDGLQVNLGGGVTGSVDFEAAETTPEPATLGLTALAIFGGIGLVRRRAVTARQ